MSEAQILEAIANYCQDERLVFQVIIADRQAHIYINRLPEYEIDYFGLTDNLVAAVSSLDDANIDRVCLYSRVSGETEPDWQTEIDLMAIATESEIVEGEEVGDRQADSNIVESNPQDLDLSALDESAINNSPNNLSDSPSANEAVSQAQINLSTYCFIRNKRLLSSKLVVPKPKIAQLIQTFHEFADSIKAAQLTVLDDYFKSNRHLDLVNCTPEVESWWQEIQELSAEENRKAAIWLSRYCFDPEITLATVESVFIAEEEIAESQQKDKEAARSESESRSPTEYSHVLPQQSDRLDPPEDRNSRNTASNSAYSSSHKPFKINLLTPLIWLIVTLALAVFDLNQPVDALLPKACENLTQENADYCSLVTQIVGVEHFEGVIASLPEPLTPEESLVPEAMMNQASTNCELHGNIAAGVPLKEATPFKTPVLSSSRAEMLPDFYVADVQQTNLKEGEPRVRTVCFFYRVKKIGKPYSIEFVAHDRVDLDWPEVAYEPSKRIKALHRLNKTTRTYNFLSLFGVNTLFTAIAIYLIAICGMAIKVDSIETIYQASFILGMTKSILGFLPIFGIFILIPIECIALGITSACVKGFKIDWNAGYPFVAATAMLLIVSRMLFTFLFLGFLSSLFG